MLIINEFEILIGFNYVLDSLLKDKSIFFDKIFVIMSVDGIFFIEIEVNINWYIGLEWIF